MLSNLFRLPDPVAPTDHYRESRDFYRTMATQGAPGGAERRQQFAQKIFTPTNMPTTANAEAAIVGAGAIDAGRASASAEFASAEGERDARFRAEAGEALGRIETERSKDMDQYRNLMASAEATRNVMKTNLFTGVLRAGVNLATAGLGGSLIPDMPTEVDPTPNNPIGLGQMGLNAGSGFSPNLRNEPVGFSAAHMMESTRHGQPLVSPTEAFGIQPPANYINQNMFAPERRNQRVTPRGGSLFTPQFN